MSPLAVLPTYLLLLARSYQTIASPHAGFDAGLAKRDEISRGWALVADNCPDSTFRCGEDSCCPNDAYCDDQADTLSNMCCPSDSSCGFQVALDNRCADTSWSLWKTSNDPICCLPGFQGVQPGPKDDYGSCVPNSQKVAAASKATLVGSGPTACVPIPATLAGSCLPPTTARPK